jgi:hypothetical protein
MDVYENIMSYHSSGCGSLRSAPRLTEGQLDRWADAMDDHSSRRKVRSGDCWFVQPAVNAGDGRASHPFNLLDEAIIRANNNGNDIIYLRAGTYQITQSNFGQGYTIRKPVMIRATRSGSALLR